METKPGEHPGPLAAASSSFPLLVYDHGEQPDNSQTVLCVADGSWRTYQVPELSNFRCLETPQGLVLMVDTASLQCSLWNPQTGKKTALPAMDEELPRYCRCLISDTGSPPPAWWVIDDGDDLPDSLVLVYDLEHPQLLYCRIRGGAAWVRQPYDIGLYEVPGKAPTPRAIHEIAVLMGTFFFLEPPTGDAVGVLVSSAGDPEPCLEFGTFDAPMPTLVVREEEEELPAAKCYLVESFNDLFLVRLVFAGWNLERIQEVSAYRMDVTKQEWCKVTDIGDAAFLLGTGGFATSCSAAEHGLKRGCVYFACDDIGDSNDLHIFDLKQGTRREVVTPTQDIPELSRKPFWVVPVVLDL